ncbi:MAG: hypothetical protein WDA22_15395 [Bacteroidota bacterium]
MLHRNGKYVFILFVLSTLFVLGQPKIQHKQILQASQNQEIEFNAIVTDSVEVTNVELYYRNSNTTTFSWLRMTRNGNTYSLRLPKSAVTLAGIDYYILASNRTGQNATAPINAPTVYYEIIIREDKSQPFLISRYPDTGDTVFAERPEIRIGYFDDETIDRRRIRLLIDSTDVTKNSRVIPSNISYTPSLSLDTGSHTISVIIPDGQGNIANNATWSFIVRPAPPEQNPFTLQTSLATSYGYNQTIPLTSLQRTYGADVAFHASQKIGGITFSSNATVHTDQTLLPSNGKKTAKLQGFSLSASEVPVNLFFGDFSESFSEYGMSNVQLNGVQTSFSSGIFSTFLFIGDSKSSGGATQDFSGGRMEYGFDNGTTFSTFVIRGTDDTTATAGISATQFIPVKGTVVGVSGTLPSIIGANVSFEGAKSFSNMKELDKTTTDPGLAGTFSANTSISIISLNGSMQYADRYFYNPGNPYLAHDQFMGSFNAGTTLFNGLNTSAGYNFQRTGLSSDTVYQPTKNKTYSFTGSGSPLSFLNLSGSYSLAMQKGDYISITAKDNQTHQYAATAGLNFSTTSLSLSYSINDMNDYSVQNQSSVQNNIGVSFSLAPIQRMNTSLNINSSDSKAQSTNVISSFVSASGTVNYGFDQTNQNTVGVTTSFSDNSASDHSQHSTSLSIAFTTMTNFGITNTSAPQMQISTTWSRSTTFIPIKSATEDLQLYLTFSWTLNTTL